MWGDGIEVGGEAIAAGTIMTALTPTASWRIHRDPPPESWGMMTNYRDDPETKADEGANPGDPGDRLEPDAGRRRRPGHGDRRNRVRGVRVVIECDVVEFGECAQDVADGRDDGARDDRAPPRTTPTRSNPVTTIAYDLHAPVHVDLVVYSVRGGRIRHLVAQ